MENNKKNIIIAAVVVVALVAFGFWVLSLTKDNAEPKSSVPEPEIYTPQFTYIVSSSDADYADTMAVVEELKAEYGDKVEFDVRDIVEDPTLVERFPVEGMTPTLFMVDTRANTSMLFDSYDKAELTRAIEDALIK